VTILPCDILFAIQKNLDVLSRKFGVQRVPLVPRNVRINVADGDSTSFLDIIKRNVVFQRVGSRHIVVVAILPAAIRAPRLDLRSDDFCEDLRFKNNRVESAEGRNPKNDPVDGISGVGTKETPLVAVCPLLRPVRCH
jgi:hypothetical protein